MINVFKKIWQFAGNEKSQIKKSNIVSFFFAIFGALQINALYFILKALVDNDNQYINAWLAFGFMLLSVVGQIITSYFSILQRTHAGYFMVANERIHIGNKLKVVPMGYFNKNSLGNITGVATTVLTDVESCAPRVLVQTLGGFINAIVFALFVFLFDWRIGLIVVGGIIVFLLSTSLLEKKTRIHSPKRQKAQEYLVECVLETIHGMSVVKAFNLDKKLDKKVDKSIEESCKKNLGLEKAIIPYLPLQQLLLKLFSMLIILLSIIFYLNNSMTLVNCFMMLIVSFIIFSQLESAGHGTAILHLTETSIDRAKEIENVPVMYEGRRYIKPKNYDIEFNNVSFAYDKHLVLENVNLKINEKTMTAIIGPSGSGKTTLCNLIARFWDVNSGTVSIGGNNVRDYSLDSLMVNISMVFQNVYLFEDTIENNIKFGKPNATHEEVVYAAKRACCDEFISELPEGYNTLIGEGGASLSGGEKQRISIARAMLKNAPIVIFDEATANVDPENEYRLQAAIEELTKDKTIIMIAHRLKTVRNADQIIVLDKGKIVQKGKHNKLIKQKGIYADFINRREQSVGWKLKTNL
ncbi:MULTISPECIES: ABC transporter ATP-binding protein [unclassified Clostridium]|uniref:ABC transporter ATP-binding protein n=1 Tax=unclassified Clostridium TaxID=2614128 RepID=UPI0013F09FA0|nr:MULTISPECIES: ABC transporter ATP-binding protein [unclassified Clostridium]NFG61198.1 ABC transporter ATP-binding protein [Clostridium botulinum]NFQ08944.1 ABC transporter ATP-binding protein [Clostridium botulinum]